MTAGYSAVALVRCKTSDNFGTACRSAFVFDAALIQMVGARFSRQASDTCKSWRSVPVLQTDRLEIPYDCVPVAVELLPDATPLPRFAHPPRALYVFGPEDGSLPKEIVRQCARSIVIPGRFCLNLAQAVTCVLYDRAAKSASIEVPQSRLRRVAM